jgi:hypothetical protein
MSAFAGRADIATKEKNHAAFPGTRPVKERGPRWWEIQRGPKSEEFGARSEKQRQARPMAESFAPAPARQTRWHVSGVATMTGKQLWTKKHS